MPSRRRLRLTAGLATALVAALLAAGCGGGGGETTLSLTGKAGQRTEVDVGPTGPSPGDLLVGNVELFEDGRKVGSGHFTCVRNFEPYVMCTNHTALDGRGEIVSQQRGNPSAGPVVVEPIIGGTGEFKDARGEVTADFSDPAEAKLEFRLSGSG